MAYSLNRASILGNLTRDPETRTTPSGQTVTSFAVATSNSWQDKTTGEKKEATEFHNVVAWRKLGEICAQYLRKGKKVLIEGRLQTRTWEGNDGHKNYRTEIIADNMIMLDSAGQRGAGGSGAPTATPSPTAKAPTPAGANDKPAAENLPTIDYDEYNTSKTTTNSTTNNDAPVVEEEINVEDIPF